MAEAGNMTEAVANFNIILELEPENQGAIYNRGFAYLSAERFDEALADFDRLIENGDGPARFYSLRSLAYAGLGDYAAAIVDAQEYLSLEPDGTNADGVAKNISAWQERLEGAGDSDENSQAPAKGRFN